MQDFDRFEEVGGGEEKGPEGFGLFENPEVEYVFGGNSPQRLQKRPGEKYRDYLRRMWGDKMAAIDKAMIGKGGDELRNLLARKSRAAAILASMLDEAEMGGAREAVLMTKLTEMVGEELKFLKARLGKNPYFDYLSPEAVISVFVNEFIPKDLEPQERLEAFGELLALGDVTKMPSLHDSEVSFGIGQMVGRFYDVLVAKYNGSLPGARKLPARFEKSLSIKDQVRATILLMYDNLSGVPKNIGNAKRLFWRTSGGKVEGGVQLEESDVTSDRERAEFVAALVLKAHNAGGPAMWESLKKLTNRKVKVLGDFVGEFYKGAGGKYTEKGMEVFGKL